MKIIGNTADGHIVAMSREEAAMLAGYPSMIVVPDEMTDRNGYQKKFLVGTELQVTDELLKLRRIVEQETRVRQNAGLLRGLADMLEQATPSQIIPPAAAQTEDPANG